MHVTLELCCTFLIITKKKSFTLCARRPPMFLSHCLNTAPHVHHYFPGFEPVLSAIFLFVCSRVDNGLSL